MYTSAQASSDYCYQPTIGAFTLDTFDCVAPHTRIGPNDYFLRDTPPTVGAVPESFKEKLRKVSEVPYMLHYDRNKLTYAEEFYVGRVVEFIDSLH